MVNDGQDGVSVIYGPLSKEDVVFVQAAAARIREHGRRLLTEVVAIGAELLAVKARLHHGRFGAWLAEEFAFSQQIAENYMNAARPVRKNPKYCDFPGSLGALYKLAAPDTSETVRAAVLDGTVQPTAVAVQRAIAAERDGATAAAVRPLLSDLVAASNRNAENWRALVEQATPAPIEQVRHAYDALLALWNVAPTPVTLAAILLALMELPGAAAIPPGEATLVRGLSQRPRLQAVAAQWLANTQAGIAQAQQMERSEP
jgi:hypothetical protein